MPLRPYRPGRRGLAVAGGLVGVLALTGCPGTPRGDRADRPPPSGAHTASPEECPTTYAAPDPRRPRIAVTFSLDDAGRTVTGSETVVFTPDRPVTELVFRLWPNGPTATAGTRLDITAAQLGAVDAPFRTEAAGGRRGTQGTLLRLPLGRTVPAGEAVTATLRFRLGLGTPAYERWGSTGATAWWGTGHPLLAWVRGAGWQTDPAGPVGGEYAVSEAARYDVTVDAPAADAVLTSGVPAGEPVPAGPGRRRWRAVNPAARDVSVAVGRFTAREADIAGTPVVAAVSADTAADPDTLLDQVRTGLTDLTALLGPYPFPRLTVVAVPSFGGGGIEYPGGFFAGPELVRSTNTHEVAHSWFYALVGNDQASAPWLDEAFATYAERRSAGVTRSDPDRLRLPGRVGAPTASFTGSEDDYGRVVYGKGAAALFAARARVGARAFDAALRCYVHAQAWRVADPADLAAALGHLPEALAVLREAGALPR